MGKQFTHSRERKDYAFTPMNDDAARYQKRMLIQESISRTLRDTNLTSVDESLVVHGEVAEARYDDVQWGSLQSDDCGCIPPRVSAITITKGVSV